MFPELNERSRAIFKSVVDAYVATGEPVGSATVAERLGLSLSPATIRHVMAELEGAGLLHAPHISAGRLPTEAGLRFFVDGLLEIGDLAGDEKNAIEARCRAQGKNLSSILSQATEALAGLSSCAGLVLAPKLDRPLKQMQFVPLDSTHILVILVTTDGIVENRVIEARLGVDASTLVTASNYLAQNLVGKSLPEAQTLLTEGRAAHQAELDELSQKLIADGLALWSGPQTSGQLLIKGQARLLEDVTALADIERVRQLFDALETEQTIAELLTMTGHAEGVQIFIGSENPLFSHAGCSLIAAPYKNKQEQVIGAIGIVGPLRMNYARLIPMVDYTARLVGHLVD